MAKTEIRAEASLDTTKFQRGLAKSQKSINNFSSNAIKQFGAIAGAAGLGMMAKSAIDLGSKISDMAVQMNIGTDELQTLEFASREAGVGVEVMARALRNVQLRTEEAIKGNKSYGDAFRALGIDINEFKKLSVEKRMEAIAIAQRDAADSGAAYNAVARILGEKAGPALQEVLQKLSGPEGYGGLEAAAKRAGEVMSKETIAKMDAAADGIESFKRKATVATATVIGWTTSMTDWAGATAAGFVELAQGRNVWSQYEESVDGVLASMEPLEDELHDAAIAQLKLAHSTDYSTQFFYDQVQALDTLEQRLDKQAAKEEDIANKKFINAKKLEELQLRSAGKNAEADSLKKQIELTEEAMRIAKQYGITLAKAAGIVQGIEKNKPKEESKGGTSGSSASVSAQTFGSADANKSGIVTGREQRAQERAQRKAETEARRAKTREVAMESGAGERARVADRDKRFDVREAQAGLNLAGGDTTSGRENPMEKEALKQTQELENINKTLGKLESVLGN